MKYDVYISHAHRDHEYVHTVAQALRAFGLSVFTGDEVKPGVQIRSSLVSALRESKMLLALWTPDSKASDWVNYEIGYASGLGKKVLILKPGSFSVSDLPSDLIGWRVFDFDPAAPDKTVKALVSELASAA